MISQATQRAGCGSRLGALLLLTGCLLVVAGPAVAADDITTAYLDPRLEQVDDLYQPQLAMATVIIFVLMLLILWKFAWAPIMAGLARRESAIAEHVAEARRNNEKAEQLLREHEARLAAAQDEVRELIAQGRRDAEAARERVLAEADTEVGRMRERAITEIRNARDSALREIAARTVDAAVGLAGQIVQREIRPDEHAQLIRESIERFPTRT